uniref:Transmembrane protein n=1 Tax=Pithovirus LCPAC202 TaxID=2506592 RepID=A0A481Z6N6_9VIRU|nr:MAG: hypothetical protein LCPAC202_02500 [Pithovirus LCPAC202]
MDSDKYSYSVSGTGTGAGTGTGKDMSSGNGYGGRKWGVGVIIVIIIIIIIICICVWWFVSKNNKFDSCNGLAGTRWKGEGIYSGGKQNNNLQEDCFQEWIDLKFTKGHGKCARVEVNFKILKFKNYKPETVASGFFAAHGVLKDGKIVMVSERDTGTLTLEFHDDHSLSYTFVDLQDVKGLGEKSVTKAHLDRVVKHDY